MWYSNYFYVIWPYRIVFRNVIDWALVKIKIERPQTVSRFLFIIQAQSSLNHNFPSVYDVEALDSLQYTTA